MSSAYLQPKHMRVYAEILLNLMEFIPYAHGCNTSNVQWVNRSILGEEKLNVKFLHFKQCLKFTAN